MFFLFRFSFLGLLFTFAITPQFLEARERVAPQDGQERFLSFAPVARKATPAVVNVYSVRAVENRVRGGLGGHPFFRYFFEGRGFGVPRARAQASLGSGVLVSGDGMIVTNNHVVAGAVDIKVALADRREFLAEVVVRDKGTDLAVLRIKDSGDVPFPFLPIADSDELEVGDLVLAIGNPFGVGQTVTSGIVSALARSGLGITDYQSFIQTDAAINPGNSGGALVDMEGQLIGVNAVIFSRSGGSQGVGFAIPSNMVRLILESVGGGVIRRPWLGARLQSVNSEIAQALGMERPLGVLIDGLINDSPAMRAGLKEGDLIISVAGHEVVDVDNFGYRFATQGIEGKVNFRIRRGDQEHEVFVSLEAAPEVPPRNRTVLQGDHPLAGTEVSNLSPAVSEELGLPWGKSGVVVTGIDPAILVGLEVGDVILQVNDKRINEVGELVRMLAHPFRYWRFLVERGDQRLAVVIRN